MTANEFFRPTPTVLIGSLLITGVAAWLLLRSLVCALNGAENCFELPVFVQIILLAIFWPWALAVRFGGIENVQVLSIFGFLLSLIWVYVVLCVKRWSFSRLMRKTAKEGNS